MHSYQVAITVIFYSDFLPFGEVNGDMLAPKADDRSFGPVELATPLILFNSIETNLYVSLQPQGNTLHCNNVSLEIKVPKVYGTYLSVHAHKGNTSKKGLS